MESYKENGTIILRRSVKNAEATRIIRKSPLHDNGREFSALNIHSRENVVLPSRNFVSGDIKRADLTNNNFSVTRARAYAHTHAHARAYARENTRVEIPSVNIGLKRVVNAAISGGDVKVAAIEPMSFKARLIAFLLIPVMLVMPLAPAYANEAPLGERVATDVAEILGNTESIASNNAEEVSENQNLNNTEENTAQDNSTQEGNTSASSSVLEEIKISENETDNASSSTTSSGEVAGVSTESTSSTTENIGDVESLPQVNNQNSTQSSTTSSPDDISTSSPQVEEKNSTSSPSVSVDETVTEEIVNEIQVLDIPSEEVKEDLQALRARLKEEIKNQVRNEVKKEVEREVYNGCKNLDGIGYYCIPDAKSFGSAVVENERAITAVVQQDVVEGDKEIFLDRNGVVVQLTHNIDDDVFPVLDPNSDLLVWQSLVKGRWQIAYAHVDDVGVPKVNYLTNGENNFNPKVYRGRIVWQAWVDGNWEIFTVEKAREKIDDEALSEDHRIVHVDGNFEVKRITANNIPDMFPSVTSDSITWQSLDDGVWQVFSYDLVNGTSKRVSKKGIKSEAPRTALVWSEEDETGQKRLVGADVNNSEQIDFTALARRIVDQSKERPKSPVTNAELVVEKPAATRIEDELIDVQ